MDPVPLTIARPVRSLRARLLRWGIMAIIFVGGGVAGYCVGTMQLIGSVTPPANFEKTPDKFTEWMLAHLKKDLSLTETQYPQVEKIILQHHAAFDELRRRTQPLFEVQMAKMDRDMLAVLNESQQALWKTRMQQRGGGMWRGRPGGGRRGGPEHKGQGQGHDKKDGERKEGEPADGKPQAPEPSPKSPTA